jgi:hypothetical protein
MPAYPMTISRCSDAAAAPTTRDVKDGPSRFHSDHAGVVTFDLAHAGREWKADLVRARSKPRLIGHGPGGA